MKTKIVQDRLFSMLQAVAAITDEPTFVFTKDGVSVRAMDPSRVAMIDWKLGKDAFEDYKLEDPTEKVTVNLTELMKILRRSRKEDVVTLTTEFVDGLHITIAGKYLKNFKMSILEPLEEETPIPKVTFNADAKMTVSGLASAIEDARMVSDHVRVIVDANKVDLIAAGDLMQAEVNLKQGDDVLLQTQIKEQAKSTYSLSYLVDMMKAAKTAEIVTLSLSTDLPLRLEFDLDFQGKITYYLAPRIEVE